MSAAFAQFATHPSGGCCRVETRIYPNGNPGGVPLPSDRCRAIVFLKNPGGSTKPISAAVGTLVLTKLGKTLTRVTKHCLTSSPTPFAHDEYVMIANLITLMAKKPRPATRLHGISGSIPSALPVTFGGIWFAWGSEPYLDPFRATILSWYKGLPAPPRACFVTKVGKVQTMIVGVPALGAKVKHPAFMTSAAMSAALRHIL
jgi:hypothetical protein